MKPRWCVSTSSVSVLWFKKWCDWSLFWQDTQINSKSFAAAPLPSDHTFVSFQPPKHCLPTPCNQLGKTKKGKNIFRACQNVGISPNSSLSHLAQQKLHECTHDLNASALSLNVSVFGAIVSSSVPSFFFDVEMVYDINLPAVPVLQELLTAA